MTSRWNKFVGISIHALREEGDDEKTGDLSEAKEFLSTPSARRATAAIPEYYWRKLISIHALREEGDRLQKQPLHLCGSISIHALREEGDGFQLLYGRLSQISIHALREEGDRPFSQFVMTLGYFYPRPPRGGRRTSCRN